MYVDDYKYFIKGKPQRRVLIRHNYRDQAGKTKQKTIANITGLSDHVIEAIRASLKSGDYCAHLGKMANGKFGHTKIVGSVLMLHRIFERIGLIKVLGKGENAKLIAWLVMARLLEPGSRLSAVRLATIHAGCELLGIEELNEDLLYASMNWLYGQKDSMEQRIFKRGEQGHGKPTGTRLFLYDVSSSYLEGTHNELGAYGYKRDKKKGKKQIVYGLLTDDVGSPLGVEVFEGNTSDTGTVKRQVEKVKDKFGCSHVTLVGDKGMIKSYQIKDLHAEGFSYITSITKAEIETLIKRGAFQLELFTDKLAEIADHDVRYVLHKNPARALEIENNRYSKISEIKRKAIQSNAYLQGHKKATIEVQERNIKAYISRLKLAEAVEVYPDSENRKIEIRINENAIKQLSRLDGCYAIKTNLAKEVISKEAIHARYKSLDEVEWAFRTEKSALEIHPIYLVNRERTIAHVFICMLAYMVEKYLRACWKNVDLTVEEGIKMLSQLTGSKIIMDEKVIVRIPVPNKNCEELLKAVDVTMPSFLTYIECNVNTKRKLPSRRK